MIIAIPTAPWCMSSIAPPTIVSSCTCKQGAGLQHRIEVGGHVAHHPDQPERPDALKTHLVVARNDSARPQRPQVLGARVARPGHSVCRRRRRVLACAYEYPGFVQRVPYRPPAQESCPAPRTRRTSAANIQNAGPKATSARSLILTSATAQPMAKISAIDQGLSASARRKAWVAPRAGGRSSHDGHRARRSPA